MAPPWKVANWEPCLGVMKDMTDEVQKSSIDHNYIFNDVCAWLLLLVLLCTSTNYYTLTYKLQ